MFGKSSDTALENATRVIPNSNEKAILDFFFFVVPFDLFKNYI